jgi:hypothetical protein
LEDPSRSQQLLQQQQGHKKTCVGPLSDKKGHRHLTLLTASTTDTIARVTRDVGLRALLFVILFHGFVSERIPENNCRFLSDTRPSHAFSVAKTPDTIAALGSPDEHNPQLPFLLCCRCDLFYRLLVPRIAWQPASVTMMFAVTVPVVTRQTRAA